MKKMYFQACLGIFFALSLSGCSAVRGIGDALANSFKGFTIHFPTINFR